MRMGWAIVAGLLLGIGIAWWLGRESPREAELKQQRAQRAAVATAEDARPVLYRWHDANGVLQITDTPPNGRKYEKVDLQPRAGIQVDGARE